MANRWGQSESNDRFYFLGSKITAMVTAATKLKGAYCLEAITNLDSVLKSKDMTLPTRVYIVQAMVFPIAVYRGESKKG